MGLGFLGMKLLIAVYLILAVVFAWEGRWPFTFYWTFAAGLTGCVLWIGK